MGKKEKNIAIAAVVIIVSLTMLVFIVFAQSAVALESYENEIKATTTVNDTTAFEKLSLALNKLVARTDALIKSIFGVNSEVSGTGEIIKILDSKNTPVFSDIKTYDETKHQKKTGKTSNLSAADIPDRGELEVNALESKNVAVKLKINKVERGEIILDDLGKNNPVSALLPGRVVKFVEIGARNISFSWADITIRYTDEELNGGSENDLTIYHWSGESWDAMPTIINNVDKTLSTTTTSFSSFGVATNVTYRYLPSTGATVATGVTTNFNCPGTYPTTYSKALVNYPTLKGLGVRCIGDLS